MLDGASAVRLALAAVAAVLVLRTLEQLQTLLLVLAIASIGAVALDPPVRMLQRRGAPRGMAAAIVAASIAVAAVAIGWVVLGPLVAELVRLAQALPGYIKEVSDGRIADRIDALPGSNPVDTLASLASENIPDWLGASATWLVSMASWALLLLALTILMLVGAPTLVAGLLTMMPRLAERAPWRVLSGAYRDVSRYAGGQIAIALIGGVSSYVAMLLIGVPHALPLAGLITLLAVIPIVGAFVGGGAAVLVASADEWWKGVAIFAFLIVYQQIEGNVLGPLILGRALQISALVVVVSLAAGYGLFGILGMIIAVPAAATLNIVLGEYRRVVEAEHPERVDRAERRIEQLKPDDA